MKLKIELEKLFLLIFLVSAISMVLFLVTPISDNYWHYTVAREILRNPGFLWQKDITTGTASLISNSGTFHYPPLLHFAYAFLFLLNLTPNILDIISIIVVCYFLYRMENKALPFMFLSFLFVRIAVQGGIDIFLMALVLASLYFFEKKPLVSGVFAGLIGLVKGTTLMFFGSWLIAVLIFKRKDIANKKFYKSKYFMAIIIAFLILSTWYLRNFIVHEGDIGKTIVGYEFAKDEAWVKQGVQSEQPERFWFDTSGYYPLPIDILFYIGILFTIINLYRTKSFKVEHFFILIYVLVYFAVQILDIRTIMTIRQYLPIFPLLAIQVARGIPQKYLKFAYIGCLIFLVAWLFVLPNYAFNQLDQTMDPICKEIKSTVGSEPVYVIAYQGIYTIYKCDLNATTEADSKWTLNLDQGQLYLTNVTNITGA